MKKDIKVSELKEAIGEEGIRLLLNYINEAIKNGIDEKIDKLQTAWRNAEQVDVKYGKPGRYEQGKAIITSLSTNSAAKDKTTYSLSLKGYGPLTMPGEGEK